MESKFKGTPGKWNATETKSGKSRVEDWNGFSVCNMSSGTEQDKANAKLIAASPKILDALQDCQQLIEVLINAIPSGTTRNAACDANIIALSAINAALGIKGE